MAIRVTTVENLYLRLRSQYKADQIRRPTILRIMTDVDPGRRRSLSESSFRREKSMKPCTDNVPHRYEAIVVGAGPAGIVVVGNLIEQMKTPILWVDDEFQAGRLNKYYREVPSNTRVKLFVAFADALSTFRDVVKESQRPNAYTTLQDLSQEATCHIAEAADLCLMLTKGLDWSRGVHKKLGTVSSASWSDKSKWTITIESSSACDNTAAKISSNMLIMCTGSHPKVGSLPVSHLQDIGLDAALKPSLLSASLSRDSKIIVAVIGGSHSALLVLRNLYNLACSTHPFLRIKWFTRHPLRYAEQRDGWILRDNTGLKGEVATWARENLEEGKLELSNVSKYLEKVEYSREQEDEKFKKHLPSSTHIVQAIGFTPQELPIIEKNGRKLDLNYNHLSQEFEEKGEKISGLYGAGIAWPERVTDPEGNVSLDVGLWKFMKSVKKVAPYW
ncbi:hypothetical protein Golomagni_05882 [Golovinomyces magnicellulatus]|nr:hypothetical protein Golomagni_05882 [Golovinomyces magnicellulatus]